MTFLCYIDPFHDKSKDVFFTLEIYCLPKTSNNEIHLFFEHMLAKGGKLDKCWQAPIFMRNTMLSWPSQKVFGRAYYGLNVSNSYR